MNLEEKYAPLSPELNCAPELYHHIHLMGICGTGMGSLAGMLKDKGYRVTGSDQNIYPPMSEYLEQLKIPVLQSYRPENLRENPDLVIVGNVITRENPEAVELGRLGLNFLSFPQAVKEFAIKDKKSIVVAGTHGKTTTTSLCAWVLKYAGLEPSFMIGGVPKNIQKSFQIGDGEYFVIEGDEYDTAFFDKGPKFLHYKPWTVILTSIEFDHADIYRDLNHVMDSFRRLISIIPENGYLIANGDDSNVRKLADKAGCQKIFYSLEEHIGFTLGEFKTGEKITHLEVLTPDGHAIPLSTILYGRHNLSNLLSVVSLAHTLSIPGKALAQAVLTYSGVRRRQEVLGEPGGILLVDDFAHHPTSVKETISAVKSKYSRRRLIAVFEPRSNTSRRNIFQEKYSESFDQADLVFIPDPPLVHKIPPEERFSSSKLVRDLKQKGIDAIYAPDTAQILDLLLPIVTQGDIVLFMSNGSFGNLPQKLLKALGGSSY